MFRVQQKKSWRVVLKFERKRTAEEPRPGVCVRRSEKAATNAKAANENGRGRIKTRGFGVVYLAWVSRQREKEKKKGPGSMIYTMSSSSRAFTIALQWAIRAWSGGRKGGLESCVKGRVETTGDEDLTADK
jgi:hypothetical protein